MFNSNELEVVPIELEKLYKELEQRIMDDIVRRIKINNEITRSADWQIYRLHELGESKRVIKKYIKDTLNLSNKEINHLYKDVIRQGYTYDEQLYKTKGKPIIPFSENEELQQLIGATISQTQGEFKNITRSLGFAQKINDKIVFKPIAEYYQKTLDGAMLDITSGAFDYNTVIKRVINELTHSGLRTVDYASGWSNRVTVASRRAVMTGLAQVTAKINEDNAQQLETNYFEVSWHIGARPSHQVWQGKVYTKEQLHSICGLGTGAGLCGWNCYHNYHPFIKGISERIYTDEELEEMNAKENTPINYNGKEYTTYQASQRQRQLETIMRADRQKIKLLQIADANEEDVINARAKYRTTSAEYVRLSKTMGLPQQMERVRVDGLGNVGVGKYTESEDFKQYKKYKTILGKNVPKSFAKFQDMKYNNSEEYEDLKGFYKYISKYPDSSKEFYLINKELKELGIKDGLALPQKPKQAFILPDLTNRKDPNHIMKRMKERNITDDEIKSYMINSKVMFSQWKGQRQKFYSDEGVCVITRVEDTWLYKTAFTKHEFDETTIKILEVIKKYVK